MRNVFVAVSSFFTFLCLPAEDYPPMEIKTIYGQTYKNAQIVSVNNTTVDITYLDSNNIPVMRGIKLKELTPELQAAFGYNPAAATENERRQAAAQQTRFDQLKAQDIQLQKKLALQVQQRQSGQKVPIDLNELYQAVYLGKSAISGYVVTFDHDGALVNVTGDNSEMHNIPDNIIILDLSAPARSNWTGYIYPTMMVSRQQLPVYCVSPENAIRSVVTTLKLDPADVSANDAAIAQTQQQQQQQLAPVTSTGTSTYEYTTVYVNGGYYYPNYYPRYRYPWPDYVRPCPPRPCPPRHNDADDRWNNQHPDSKWIRRTDDRGNIGWVKRPAPGVTPRPGQPGDTPRPGRPNNNNNNNNNYGNTKFEDINGENRWVKPTDLRPYNRNTANQDNASGGSRWARRTQTENIGRVASTIPTNSNNSDNRWVRSSLGNGSSYVRNDDSQTRAVTPRNGGNPANGRNNNTNRQSNNGDGRGGHGGGSPGNGSASGRSGYVTPRAPNIGSGFTGGTIGAGSWSGGLGL